MLENSKTTNKGKHNRIFEKLSESGRIEKGWFFWGD
jgi:hypothetical protein